MWSHTKLTLPAASGKNLTAFLNPPSDPSFLHITETFVTFPELEKKMTGEGENIISQRSTEHCKFIINSPHKKCNYQKSTYLTERNTKGQASGELEITYWSWNFFLQTLDLGSQCKI